MYNNSNNNNDNNYYHNNNNKYNNNNNNIYTHTYLFIYLFIHVIYPCFSHLCSPSLALCATWYGQPLESWNLSLRPCGAGAVYLQLLR